MEQQIKSVISEKDNSMKRKIIPFLFLVLSLLATIKICFLGLGIDEEYAVTMAYRMATGDRMFLDMWEPHQTSGFLSTALVRIFLTVTRSTDYLVLYLRCCGALIQAFISLFLYNTLKRYFNKRSSFVAAIFFYNTLPKWIQTPEFANMLTWFSVLLFSCLLRYYLDQERKPFWLIAGGASFSGLVLSYPSCILVLPVLLFGMQRLEPKKFLKQAALLLGTCGGLALFYLGYFLHHMTSKQFLFGLKQMMIDGEHSETFLERLIVYGKELSRLLPQSILLLGIAALLLLLWKYFVRQSGHFGMIYGLLSLCIVLLGQAVIWMGNSPYLQYPLLYFYFLYGFGIFFCINGRNGRRNQPKIEVLFWIGSVTGGAIWLSALLITNTTISVTGSYLMIGLLAAICMLSEADREENGKGENVILFKGCLYQRILYSFTMLCLLGLSLFAKGYLMYENQGFKNDITYVKQKALSGPAKGIYYRYTDGYEYNLFAEFAEQYIDPGDRVLYIGQNMLYYLLCGDITVSTYSTISTPTFDERLFEYWELRPEHSPNVIVVNTAFSEADTIVDFWELGKPDAEIDNAKLYRLAR